MTRGEDALTSAGWYQGRDVQAEALSAVFRAVALVEPAPDAFPWVLFPAAEQALRAFHGLSSRPVGPGHEVAPTGWLVDPVAARHARHPLSRLAESTGSRLFPLGRTDADAILAVDDEGRLFSVDHGGQWQLGETVREGLAALAEGRAPHRIAAQRWAWNLSSPNGEPLVDVIRTALVAVYVLHHRHVFSVRDLRLTVAPLRGIAPVALDCTVPLPGGRLEDNLTPLATRMEALLETAGVATRGAEIKVEVCAPRGTTAPLSSVSCAVRTGHLATAPATVELSLAAGAGASVGRLRTAVQACSRDLARQVQHLSP